MSETTHAPGPWGYRWEKSRAGRAPMINVETQPFAEDVCGIYNAGAEQEANAQLIAAAPELLAALEGMLEGIRPADQDLWTHLARYREAAEAALKKAKGT